MGQIISFLPHFMAMLVIVGLGGLAAWVAKTIIHRFLLVIKIDPFLGRMGLPLVKGEVRETPSFLISRFVFWSILLVFLMLGLGALQLRPVDQFVARIFSYLPHLLVTMVILVVGFLMGNFFARAALIAAVNAQMTQARFIARGVRLAIILFALAMAFEQMGIATAIIVAAFSISFGGLVLALAIAFGLGSKDVAKDFIEKRFGKEQQEKEEDFSHL